MSVKWVAESRNQELTNQLKVFAHQGAVETARDWILQLESVRGISPLRATNGTWYLHVRLLISAADDEAYVQRTVDALLLHRNISAVEWVTK